MDRAICDEDDLMGFPSALCRVTTILAFYEDRCPVKIRWIRAGVQTGSTTCHDFHSQHAFHPTDAKAGVGGSGGRRLEVP